MEPLPQYTEEFRWAAAEKKEARSAFDQAFQTRCAMIAAEARHMMGTAESPSDIWRVHDYLSEHRRAVDRTFDYRYSVLLEVFAELLREGWLTELDLAGLQKVKVDRIKFVESL